MALVSTAAKKTRRPGPVSVPSDRLRRCPDCRRPQRWQRLLGELQQLRVVTLLGIGRTVAGVTERFGREAADLGASLALLGNQVPSHIFVISVDSPGADRHVGGCAPAVPGKTV